MVPWIVGRSCNAVAAQDTGHFIPGGEISLVKTVEFPVDPVHFGEVVSVHVDEAALKNGAPDWSRIAPPFFTFPDKGYWMLGNHAAEAWSIGKKY